MYLKFSITEQNPSWEANSSSPSQNIPWILWHPNVHYCIDKSPPLVPVTKSQISPVHVLQPTTLRFIFTISSQLCLGLPSGLLPSESPMNTLLHLCPPHTCHMPCQSPSWLYHPHNIWWGVQIIKFPHYAISSTSLLPCPTWTQISSSAPYSPAPSDYVPPSLFKAKSHTNIEQFIIYTSPFYRSTLS